jgi:hypothetical protein
MNSPGFAMIASETGVIALGFHLLHRTAAGHDWTPLLKRQMAHLPESGSAPLRLTFDKKPRTEIFRRGIFASIADTSSYRLSNHKASDMPIVKPALEAYSHHRKAKIAQYLVRSSQD